MVNDDSSQLFVASTILEEDGLEVSCYTSAEAALEVILRDGPVDLIITDLNMPGMDGPRFCKLLRSSEYSAFNNIPILIVSATCLDADAQQVASQMGAEGFLPVPYEPTDLCQRVNHLLRRKEQAYLSHSQGAESRPYPAMTRPFAALWEQIKDAIIERVTVVERAAMASIEGSLSYELRVLAQREATNWRAR